MSQPGCGGRLVLLHSGYVYAPTVKPPASAMLTVDGTVTWVGSSTGAFDAPVDDDFDEVVDLGGRLVTPAFVDAHVHLSMTGRAMGSLDLSQCDSLREALVDIETYAARLATDALVYASGWDEGNWPERRPPTLRELDAASGGRAVYAARVDSHSAAVSSALVGHDPEVVSQPGWRGDGTVERDAHHAARAVVRELWTDDERRSAIRSALRYAAAQGIGSVHELNAPHISSLDDFSVIEELRSAEPLPDVVCYWGELHGGDVSAELVSGFAGDLTVDGSIGSRTAWLEDGYADAATRGNRYLDADDVAAHISTCTRRNVQGGFHVIGDAALNEVVTGLRRAADTVGRAAMIRSRHRLEHVEMPSSDALATLAELGVVASVQPAFDATWGFPGGLYEQRLGRRRETMNPFRSFQRADVRLAFGSDSPVTPMAPWAGVRAAVSHSNPDERLDPHSAFAAATAGGHAAAKRDGNGVLSPGKAATYAVWDVTGGLRDGLPNLCEGGRLPQCVRTVVNGAVVYDGCEGAA